MLTLDSGTHLGPYRIDARLGEGGMGVVYRATDTRLQRSVAIKVLADDLADADARRRFQREAQTASSLNHPHLLTVHDVGEHEGRQFLVLELVDGGTLADWSAGGRRTWRQIVELMTGVADGLAAVKIRCNAVSFAVSPDESTIYFIPNVATQHEIYRAPTNDGPATTVTKFSPALVPFQPHGMSLSPDGRWLATAWIDGGTTNLWAIPVAGGPFRQLTDFGRRPTLIARQVSWSSDGKFLFAAVIDSEADIVLFDGLR